MLHLRLFQLALEKHLERHNMIALSHDNIQLLARHFNNNITSNIHDTSIAIHFAYTSQSPRNHKKLTFSFFTKEKDSSWEEAYHVSKYYLKKEPVLCKLLTHGYIYDEYDMLHSLEEI